MENGIYVSEKAPIYLLTATKDPKHKELWLQTYEKNQWTF